jgi:hypothetical protein
MQTNKILVCRKINKVDKINFDKIIYTDYDFEHETLNYFNFAHINIENLDKKNHYIFKKFLESFDEDFSSKNKVAKNVNFFYYTAIERCVKYSKIIEALLANLDLNNKKKNIFYLCKNDLSIFRFKFLLFYLKYLKNYTVEILETSDPKKKIYYRKSFSLLYLRLIFKAFILKIINILALLIKKFNFFLYNLKKREGIKIILDNLDPSFLNNNNFNFFFLKTKKKNKNFNFNLSFLKSYSSLEKYFFQIIYDETKSSLNLIYILDKLFINFVKSYQHRHLIYTYPPTIYDSIKSLIIQLSKKYSFHITSFQHGGDYAYQKNFISHFLKDFNNCHNFYSLYFDHNYFYKNYQSILPIFKINFFKMITLKNNYIFKNVWNLRNNIMFLKESEKINLFICSRYDCSLNEEMLNYSKIFLEEKKIIQSLVKKHERLIVKLPEQYYFEYYNAIKPLLRKNDLLIHLPGIRKLLVLFHNINIFSATVSTALLEAKLLNKKVTVTKNSKLYYNQINPEIYKLLI